VQSQLRKGASLAQIAEKLAAEIADAKERTAFIRKFSGSRPSSPGAPAPSTPGSGVPTQQRFSPEQLAKAESDLAQYIGAVARVVVKRAAAKARDLQELYSLLGQEIENADDKRTFVRKGMSTSGRPQQS